ncbi:hypothetical protein GBF38_007746 [Nibea albiflora]|uniref:Uncharacterized protein n=1 Tax=Nibea albiflora TaxID=240163 RepID=A0ACB7ENK2_NIBAL|nr:hypothetical protein GBF38_007746 [Nibea albiflora]
MSTEREGHGLMLSFDPPDHLVESPPNVQRVDLPEDDHTPVRPDYTVDVPLVPDDHPTDIVQLATGVATPAESVRLTGSDCPDIQSDDVPDTTTDTETMPTQKACSQCKEKIGVATKTCKHCGTKQPAKERLEKKKEKFTDEWKERQKKNSSINKIYDATNLLLHKWNLLERHPVLFLSKRTKNGIVAEFLCPWDIEAEEEEVEDSLATMQRIYEKLLNGNISRFVDKLLRDIREKQSQRSFIVFSDVTRKAGR